MFILSSSLNNYFFLFNTSILHFFFSTDVLNNERFWLDNCAVKSHFFCWRSLVSCIYSVLIVSTLFLRKNLESRASVNQCKILRIRWVSSLRSASNVRSSVYSNHLTFKPSLLIPKQMAPMFILVLLSFKIPLSFQEDDQHDSRKFVSLTDLYKRTLIYLHEIKFTHIACKHFIYNSPHFIVTLNSCKTLNSVCRLAKSYISLKSTFLLDATVRIIYNQQFFRAGFVRVIIYEYVYFQKSFVQQRILPYFFYYFHIPLSPFFFQLQTLIYR